MKTIIKTEKYDLYEFGNFTFAIKNARKPQFFFKNTEKCETFDEIENIRKRYYLMKPQFFDVIKKQNDEMDFYSYIQNIDLTNQSTIDEAKLVYLDLSTYMYFNKDDIPISFAMFFDYMDGVKDETYDVEKVLAHLKKDKRILSVKIEEIPWYTTNKRGIQFECYLPQEEFVKLWDMVKHKKLASFELIRIMRGSPHTLDAIDLWNIKQFKLNKTS